MPLEKGKSKAVIQRNIREMIATGSHTPQQAEAAAYRMAGEKRRPKRRAKS